MLGLLFPLAYALVFIGLLLQAFQMMKVSGSSALAAQSDRTGLPTVYPELLDHNGRVTSEELWAVRFSDQGDAGWVAEVS